MEHRIYAALYDRICGPAEAAGLGDLRSSLLAGATGRVLEVGGGTGANLAHYSGAESVTVLEPDLAMARRLEPRLGECPVPATLVRAGIDDADLDEGSFDTVVCTLVLCTVPDLDRAVRHIERLLAPGGRVLFLEHTAAPGGWGVVQVLADPLWKRAVPGCHLHRDPVTALRRAGLLVDNYERVDLPLVRGLLSSGAVGSAVRPEVATPVSPGTYPMHRPLRRRVAS
jgi:SAM-dependent methyltransferase